MTVGLELEDGILSGGQIRPRPLGLKQNTVWTATGSAAYAAIQWLQVALIARNGSAVEVGRYALALGQCAPVFMLANLQLRPIQVTDSLRRWAFADYLGLRLMTTAAALVTTWIVVSLYSSSLQGTLLVVAIGVSKSFESVSEIYQGLFQQHERMDCVGRSLLLRSMLILPIFGLVYYATASLEWATVGMAFAQLLTLLLFDMRASDWIIHGVRTWSFRTLFFTLERPRFHLDTVRTLAIRALPLGITMMLISLHANAPRYFIEERLGAAGLGIFAAIAYLPAAGAMAVNAVGSAASPRLAFYATQHDFDGFRRTLTKLVAIAGVLGVAGIAISLWIGHDLLQLFYGAEYAKHSSVLAWSMTAAALSYVGSVFGYAATALGRFRGQPWALGLTLLALLGSATFLVPRFGLNGAALATVISSATCLCSFIALVCWRAK